ncbi:MAG TPA: hypothetical protein VMM12_04270, partial [Longimicrobiales bacterium]|nr:hypothetical protein [Longimicrobiales bacterium]
MMRTMGVAVLALALAAGAEAQGVTRFLLEGSGPVLAGEARAGVYVGDQGRRAAVFGDESGAFEVWSWPLKLVRDLR